MGGMGYFAALAITLFLAAFVRITVINGTMRHSFVRMGQNPF